MKKITILFVLLSGIFLLISCGGPGRSEAEIYLSKLKLSNSPRNSVESFFSAINEKNVDNAFNLIDRRSISQIESLLKKTGMNRKKYISSINSFIGNKNYNINKVDVIVTHDDGRPMLDENKNAVAMAGIELTIEIDGKKEDMEITLITENNMWKIFEFDPFIQ